jgi:uncharacterized protein YcgL (UPF0745 family)
MQCVIYKGPKKPDSYLFVEREDDFSRIPEALLTMFGDLEYVMTLELHEHRLLARVSAAEVMQKLAEQGYFLQLPPGDTRLVLE